jgi:hypothetical protein
MARTEILHAIRSAAPSCCAGVPESAILLVPVLNGVELIQREKLILFWHIQSRLRYDLDSQKSHRVAVASSDRVKVIGARGITARSLRVVLGAIGTK